MREAHKKRQKAIKSEKKSKKKAENSKKGKHYDVSTTASQSPVSKKGKAQLNFAMNAFLGKGDLDDLEIEKETKQFYNKFEHLIEIDDFSKLYQIGNEMSKFALGAMYNGMHLQSGLNVQITVISKAHVYQSLKNEEKIKTVLNIMRDKMHDMINDSILATYDHLHDDQNFYIINAQAKGGTLAKYLEGKKHQRLPEAQVKSIAVQLLAALNHLVQRKVLLREIDPESILILNKVADENDMLNIAVTGFRSAVYYQDYQAIITDCSQQNNDYLTNFELVQ